MKVCAIVVTFNRKELLKKCLDGLLNQTRQLDEVLIVDNHSSDGTEDYLKSNNYLEKANINFIRLNYNSGGAGGFHNGLKHALETDCEWFWLMDDDVIPTQDGLENILKYSSQYQCIQPSRIFSDGSRYLWHGHFDTTVGRSFWFDSEDFNEDGISHINYGCFEGMFISRKRVNEIGLPDERFFIFGDDLAYGLLASLKGNVAYVKDVALEKQLKNQLPESVFGYTYTKVSNLAMYCNIRNHFLIIDYLEEYFESNKTKRYLFLLVKILKKIFESLIIERNLKKTIICLKAVWYGARRNFRHPLEVIS